jgi:Raf kinase inhibitor-like YbhB/YbcL family protein
VARLLSLLALTAAFSACGSDDSAEPGADAPPSIDVTSPAFSAGKAIPKEYGCDDAELSPPLEWSGVPKSARSLVLLMDDPDASGGTFTHWTVYGIAPKTTSFPEGERPRGSRAGENSFGDVGYGGPCPPEGDEAHRYVFAIYALRDAPELERGATAEEVRDAIDDGAITRGRLVGTFKRG